MSDRIQTYESVSQEEIEQAAATLAKFKPGFLPFPIFMELGRLNVFSIIEVVPCRRTADGAIEVLLLKRPDDDPLWPGMWCNPGTVLRPTDRVEGFFDDAFARIFDEELATAERPQPWYIEDRFHHTRRGTESAHLFCIELTESPQNGTFFKPDELPANTIESHVPIIQIGTTYFADIVSTEA